MSITGAVLITIFCFLGGYAVVTAILSAFSHPRYDPQDLQNRAVLGVSARAGLARAPANAVRRKLRSAGS
jgi:hypothetical protein